MFRFTKSKPAEPEPSNDVKTLLSEVTYWKRRQAVTQRDFTRCRQLNAELDEEIKNLQAANELLEIKLDRQERKTADES